MLDPREFAAALGQYAAGVCLLTVQDEIDDVGTTVTSVMSVSADPPLVAVGLTAGGYPVEVLEAVGRCGLTVLGTQHAIVASRFSSAGSWVPTRCTRSPTRRTCSWRRKDDRERTGA